MINENYINEYGEEEKCLICKESYTYYEMDRYEPLVVYKCKCGKKKYKPINNYEG